MKNYAIIVAGGKGTRMKSGIPKQFLPLGGLPVLMHTLNAFTRAMPDIIIILVLPANHQNRWRALCKKYNFTIPHLAVNGGITRFHSVKNGLRKVSTPGTVAVHDGVRPLVSHALIKRCFAAASRNRAVVPAVPVKESLRKITGQRSEAVSRDSFVAVQTPQCFSSLVLHKAYNLPYKKSFTDDASVVEAAGFPIFLIGGEEGNIKITAPADLLIAEKCFLRRHIS